ncbi:uncharacterized protein LOC8062514 isoform X2 [Sorghum bicolor]|nr:uncharacterized protein LOC8062514 isoform X2 [Sorghum bicolor]OQU91373.1 hypothetical protein SORBI_3001G168000 [Sorghum bicolor]|eukprot:XP_002464234.1 uncharacterized protein LOC8062514 isoform X2 [Sorghum bicolor]
MELGGGGGDSAAMSARLSSDDAAAAAAGEDRLSTLPDDVLVLILILLKLSTPAPPPRPASSPTAGAASGLSALLPVLHFTSPPEPHRLRDAHEVLVRALFVGADGATPESLAVWLPAAARRVSGDLTLFSSGPVKDEDEEQAGQRGAFEFPCFEKATSISLDLAFQGLAVPPTGVFTRLTELHLSHVWFHGPGELGDAVSSRRCPCLQSLTVDNARGLRDLSIHSESLLVMVLRNLRSLSQLTVVVPALKELTVASCFLESRPVANISGPHLANLDWTDQYDPSSVHFGKMEHLRCLGTSFYLVYPHGVIYNHSCLTLFQRFEGIIIKPQKLTYPPDIWKCQYEIEDMAVLPDITFLRLVVMTNGHAFGASAFHVLRLSTGIRRLMLLLSPTRAEAQTIFSSDCICLEQVEWKTEELLLNHLEEVEITGWRGTEHEVAFVERLFDWGTKLKEMTVNFHRSISEVNAKELYQVFRSFSRPGVSTKFYLYQKHRKVLYAPEY